MRSEGRGLASLLALVACSPAPGVAGGESSGGATTTATSTDQTATSSSSGGAPPSETSVADAERTGTDTGDEASWEWSLPPGFPPPPVPPDNPMSAAKVELGRHLFYDTRLSSSGTHACASCHIQALGFTDGRATSVGETGQVHRRNAPSLANVGYAASLTWADPSMIALEDQALVPMFGADPIELGLESEAQLVANLAAEPRYDDLFAAAFPDDAAPLSLVNVTRALAAFQRTLVSGGSPFDVWFYGTEYGDISDAAVRGWELFNAPPADCFRCHSTFNLTDATAYDGGSGGDPRFHNIALYNTDGAGAYPVIDQGLSEHTGLPQDMGGFKTPGLRNVAVTGPYMHDGSIATLGEVIDHYAVGGRTIASGPNAGVGADSPLRSEFVHAFDLTADERADMIAFLESLTDQAFLTDPALADPWVD